MGDFLLGLALGIMGTALVARQMEDRANERASETLQAAKNMEIKEGVTLSEGISAYFGGKTHWSVPDSDWVLAVAGLNAPAATLFIYPETGEIKISHPASGGIVDEVQRDFLLILMAEKALERRAARKLEAKQEEDDEDEDWEIDF